MSGGVDSSVAAALLKGAGFGVRGVFMKLYPSSPRGSEKRARKVAQILKIPFYVLNFEKEFKKKVVDYFLREYKRGRTPNPCIVCNKEIKFGLLLEKALGLKADFVASGHYAKVQKKFVNSQKIRYSLIKAKDKEKDQSYFLWQLNQKQLKRILFPIGDYSKKEVRDLAKKFKLPVLNVPESQEICFIQTTVNDFLARYIKPKPGPILTIEGKKIDQHQGLSFYTIGQRKGIELPGGPFYVVKKDFKRNALIVTPFSNDKALCSKSLVAENVNWISGSPSPKALGEGLKIKAQIRYGHKAVPATITKKLKGGKIELEFGRAQRAVTPGQSVVFYLKEEVLGGGVITS